MIDADEYRDRFPTRETRSTGRSFEDVFSAEFPPLHAYLARRLGAPAAEDLAAETFAVVFRRWEDLDPSRPVRPWLYGVATNLLRRHWRTERRMLRAYARSGSDPLVADDVVTERLDAQSAGATLASALADLRREEREVLLLKAWAELTDGEIADALGLPLGTVKSRLSRARQRMRNRLDGIGQLDVGSVVSSEEQQ